MTSLKQLKLVSEDYIIIEDLSSFESSESLFESLGNLPAGSLDLMKAHRSRMFYEPHTHKSTQRHHGIGHYSIVHPIEYATKENINKHATSLHGFGKKEASPDSEHVATLIYVHGKPHSLVSIGSHIRPENESEQRRRDFEYSWSSDNVGPLSKKRVTFDRTGNKRKDFADVLHRIANEHGEENVHLQRIGKDPHNIRNRERSNLRDDEDRRDIDKIRQNHAEKFINKKVERGNPQTEKHAEEMMNIIDKIHSGLAKGEKVSHHVENLIVAAMKHDQSRINPKEYTSASSDIEKAKHVLGHGRDRYSYGKDKLDRVNSLKRAKEYLRKTLGTS